MSKRLAGLLIGLGASLTTLALGLAPFVETVELKTYDWRVRAAARPDAARQDIVIIDINEATLRALEPAAGRWPWPRAVHSTVIDFFTRAGARVIAIDILFIEPDTRTGFQYGGAVWSGRESDAALVASTRASGRVVLLADAVFEGVDRPHEAARPEGTEETEPGLGPAYDVGAGVEERPTLTPPFAELAGAAAALGHNFLAFDRDGPARRYVPFVRTGSRVVPSLGVAAAIAAEGVRPDEIRVERDAIVLRDRRLPILRGRAPSFRGAEGGETVRALVNFRGPAVLDDGRTRTYRTYSYYDVLYSEEQILAGQKPDLDPAAFKNAIVFIGSTAEGLFDVFQTPFERGRMPGAQLHANVADNLLSGRFIRPAGTSARVALVVAAALAGGLVFALFGLRLSLPIAALLAAGFGMIAVRLFAAGLWIDVAQPALALAIAAFGGVGYQYFVEGREKRLVKQVFGRYVPRDVFEQLMANPSLARLGGRRREMTVLFSDVRGFTTMTEQGEPEAIVAQLNEYFSHMVAILFRHRGTVDKFVGDMVMALFGAPLDDERHADHAVEAALDMVRELQALNARWAAEGRPPLDIGIGINTGEMIAGNIGSEAIMSYTVIGDAVNLGARLESLNKEYGTRIIISDATRSRLRGDHPLRPLGEVVVKGKTRPVAILEVTAQDVARTS